MAGFQCPFCGQVMSVNDGTCRVRNVCFGGDYTEAAIFRNNIPGVEVSIYRCPNDDCGKETVFVTGFNGCMENRREPVYPGVVFNHYPDYVPQAVRADYEEACAIQGASPKAAATLARRCLQGMIRDFWKAERKKSLFAEIDAIKDAVPAAQWMAIDAVRTIGNIGAHMERDVDLIIDVEPVEAEKLLKLIELLIEKWYIGRNDEQELYRAITETGGAKAEAKKG